MTHFAPKIWLFYIAIVAIAVLCAVCWTVPHSVDAQCTAYSKPAGAALEAGKECPDFTLQFVNPIKQTDKFCIDDMDAREAISGQDCNSDAVCKQMKDANGVLLSTSTDLGMKCIQNKCLYAKLGVDDKCSVSEQCQSKLCSNGVCTGMNQAEGASCDTDAQDHCKSGLMCATNLNGAGPTCQKVAGLGDACVTNAKDKNQCYSDKFKLYKIMFSLKKSDEVLTCSTTTNKCISAFSDAGETCNPSVSGFPHCFDGYTCDTVSETCKKLSELNEPCGSGCAKGLACDAGTQTCKVIAPKYCSASIPNTCDTCICSDNEGAAAAQHTGQCAPEAADICTKETLAYARCMFTECAYSIDFLAHALSTELCPLRNCKTQLLSMGKCTIAHFKGINSKYEHGRLPEADPTPEQSPISSSINSRSVNKATVQVVGAAAAVLLATLVA